jgi:hypothetical protein
MAQKWHKNGTKITEAGTLPSIWYVRIVKEFLLFAAYLFRGRCSRSAMSQIIGRTKIDVWTTAPSPDPVKTLVEQAY